MRFIPTRIHGIVDYGFGLLLIAAPWLFGFASGGAESWIPVLLGAGALAYSLFTDYEMGAVRRIPMPVHLGLDGAGGALLLLSPWLFGFSSLVLWPHVILGGVEMVTALSTRTVPDEDREAPPARTRTGAQPATGQPARAQPFRGS